MPSTSDPLHNIQQYYGSTIRSRSDLCTSACTFDETSEVTRLVREARSRVHLQVQDRSYGCGSPIPPVLDGLVVLDMGCGSGHDCFVLSQLVGPRGRVIGVDASADQIATARRYVDWHTQQFGYSNVEFLEGRMEDIAALGITNDSIDVVVSNCVLNLSVDKAKAVREIFRVLKPGGELYLSDIFADRRLSPSLMQDSVLHGECLAGAWYREDMRRLLAACGCADLRIISSRPIILNSQHVAEKVEPASFTACTIRAFKLELLEDRCEDFGQIATYLGTVPGYPNTFPFDASHTFVRDKRTAVCGNTADMLTLTRYAPFFEVQGSKKAHYGLFPCSGSSFAYAHPPKDPHGRSTCC